MDCLFCKIIAGEIPSTKVYEDDDMYAFRDINPEAPCHVLVVPKTHIPSMDGVNAENSAGTLAMLKDGARLVTCGWDVLEDFQSLYPGKLHDAGRLSSPASGRAPEPDVDREVPAPPEQKPVDKEDEPVYIDLREQLAGLPEDQLAILAAIDRESTHVDDIIQKTGLPTASVLRHLTILSIKNYVRRNPGNFYQLNITKK